MLSCGSGTVSGTLQFHTGQSVSGQSEPGGFSPALSVAVTALVLLCHLPAKPGWLEDTDPAWLQSQGQGAGDPLNSLPVQSCFRRCAQPKAGHTGYALAARLAVCAQPQPKAPDTPHSSPNAHSHSCCACPAGKLWGNSPKGEREKNK